MKKISLMMAVLAAISANSSVQARGAPNFYKCSGHDTNLVLFVGVDTEIGFGPFNTELNLKTGKINQTFSKDQINTTSNLIGDIYQVALPVPNGNTLSKHASVIIPKVIVDGTITKNAPPAPNKFKTQLIITNETIVPDQVFSGVVNPSSYISLSCRAQTLY